MIELTLAQQILNILFQTKGVAGMTASEEYTMLSNKGYRVTGRTAREYKDAYVNDERTTNGDTTKQYNDEKAALLYAQWWTVTSAGEAYRQQEFDVSYRDNSGEMHEEKRSFTGWTLEQRDEPKYYYPTDAYLALFTQMPDENGANYVEPAVGADEKPTTYIRVSLHDSLITGNETLQNASANEDGVSEISNKEIIMYPEVYGTDWGTIEGIGIFDSKTTGSGRLLFWGKIKNEQNDSVVANTEHVPLFRRGDFKVSLQ